MAYQRQIPGGPFLNETATAQRQIPGGPFVNETVAAAGGSTITTATLPAGLGAMGSGQTRAIQSAGVSYMG